MATPDLAARGPGRLQRLLRRDDLKQFHSIWINDQWRVVFRWADGHAYDVAIVDYH